MSRDSVAINGWMLPCLCILAGCAPVGPDYQRPEVSLPATFAAMPAASTQAPVASGSTWWSLYQDPVLDALMTSALSSNLDLRQAVARIEEADANLRIAGTALLPAIDFNSSASRSHVSTRTSTSQFVGNPVRNNIRFGLSTNFEIDFWGKYRRAAEAARAEAMGTRFARDTGGAIVDLAARANLFYGARAGRADSVHGRYVGQPYSDPRADPQSPDAADGKR